MNQQNDGGPAFPTLKSSRPATDNGMRRTDGLVQHFTDGGLSLRDYFAAKAMQGRLMAGFNEDADSSGMEAVIAYQIADAMLAARSAT